MNPEMMALIVDIRRLHQKDPIGFEQAMENMKKLNMSSINDAVDRALIIAKTD
ncbi:MAG: hypothetical protein HF975_04430 [ANME-2 cluster archaeon]|nr:hypothetical protein [ANME-2 cluster archaeon]